ncbi:MAG: EamA/RhaT family transporter [Synergistetes bacterium HGW-Synergistetes-2]|jgi:drug/metabolite transporter (DMT)-like permease|nr:MAG: EamA/RhaT family transporter [Synergistetes bacterium HGW-Synergistetes-2]
MHLSPSLKTVLADISLVFVALFWGIGFVAMKDALDTFPTFWLLTLRFGSAALLMGILFRRRLAAITKEDIRAGAIIGVFLFLGFATQTLGLNYTTPGKQAFLTATYVVIVPFLSWGLRRIFPGALSFFASFICLVGMGMLTLQEGVLSIGKGDTLTLVCAFFFACQLIAIEYFAAKKDPMILTLLQILMVCLLSLPAALVFETWPGFQGGSGLWSIAYTVVFCTIFAFAVQNTAQKFTPSTHTAILLSLESVFGALSGIYFLGEVFTPRMAAGCALIFVAVLLTEAGPSLVRSVSLRVAAAREKA